MADINQIINATNAAAAMARQAIQIAQQSAAVAAQTSQVIAAVGQMAQQTRQLHETVIAGMKVQGQVDSTQRPDIQRIENIPGRRIPYDVIVRIAVGANETNALDGQHTLSADGPFVAVARSAVFLSAYQFQVTSGGATTTFNGRSFGRYRPVSSVLDLMDAQGGHTQPVGAVAPGTGLFSLVSTNQHAGFRTMQFDGTIEVESGSGYKRQSEPVPSALWAPGLDQMTQLPALDLFQRGDIIRFRVVPNHVNNPGAGNVQTLVGALPYLASQYDTHEGIVYGAAVADPATADIVVRQPDGILVLAYHGYKILAAPTMP